MVNVSGALVMKRLERTLEKVRLEAAEVEEQLREKEEKLHELLAKRGKALVRLGKHYLPELNRKTIQNTFSEIQDQLLQIVERKERRYQQIKGQADRLSARKQICEARLKEIVELIAREEAGLLEKEMSVAEILKKDDVFQKLTTTALQAEERLTRNEERLAEIEQDSKEKLPDYEKSSLFQYMLNRDFGTTKYSSKGWTRRWDQWIARTIDFGELKQSYLFLKKTPELMRKELSDGKKISMT